MNSFSRPANSVRSACLRARLSVLVVVSVIGCNTIKAPPPSADKGERPDKGLPVAAPGKHSLRVSQFVFLSDFELKRDQPLFQELADLREEVHNELQLPTANAVVQVYLFEGRDRYERFMQARYPELPRRRAFFVAQPHSVGTAEDLLVYTYWGDRIQQDLRHELTHALLHSVLKDVPLWLDEGLAEFFEVPPDWKGINYRHLDQMQPGLLKADLARLEQLSQVSQMTPAEYREAWAWVHLMLRGKPELKPVLLAYLRELRTNPNPGPLQSRLAAVLPSPNVTLERHVAQLESTTRSAPRAQR